MVETREHSVENHHATEGDRPHNNNDDGENSSTGSKVEELTNIPIQATHQDDDLKKIPMVEPFTSKQPTVEDNKISAQEDPTKPSSPSNLDNHSPPQDKYYLITIIFFLQGMGELFPWNAMLSAVDYLLRLYNEQKIMLAMTSAYSIATLLTLFVLIKFGTYIPYIFRIYVPYFIITILLVVVPLLYVVVGNREIEFYIILVVVVLMAFCTGSIQSCIFGLSSKLPPRYMNTVVSGK